MTRSAEPFNASPILKTLKDFQLRTARHAFRQLYDRKNGSRRFLVADEVGLGKTLVARGIIAKAIERLENDPEVDRIDIVYVCSNAAIAQQNVNRLNVTGENEYAVATRLTLLPLELENLGKRKLNFVSFTPGTTFDLKGSTGIWKERVLLFHVLRTMPGLHRGGLMNLLRCSVKEKYWQEQLRDTPPYDEVLIKKFIHTVREDQALFAELEQLAQAFRRNRPEWPKHLRDRRNALIGALRRHLAKACVDALEPDLVILDEFQRFKALLDKDSEAGKLAQELMSYQNVRVLLLSATPYKMLTLYDEEENHYADFLRTLEFLFAGDLYQIQKLRADLEEYRFALFQGHADGKAARDRLQKRLHKVMSRTERVPLTRERDAMLHEPAVPTTLTPSDLRRARALDELVRATGAPEAIEYWKSAPYLLNFMKGYAFKERFLEQLDGGEDLNKPLEAMAPHLLDREKLKSYAEIDPGNARLRALVDRTLSRQEWRLLWLPPSLPYTRSSKIDAANPITKSLVFSTWNVVPDVIAAVCSYTAERERVRISGPADYFRLYDERKPLLAFRRSDGRPETMSTLLMLYPSPTLSRLIDPLQLAVEAGRPLSVDEQRATMMPKVEKLIARLPGLRREREGREDWAWHWAALARRDSRKYEAINQWLRKRDGWRGLMERDQRETETSIFADHVELFCQAADSAIELGAVPADLRDVFIELSLGSPAICASRALRRVASDLKPESPAIMEAAAQIAEGFRSLFNSPDVRSMLESDELPYWRQVLRYCAEEDLQAVLDEYVHTLKESLGLGDAPSERVVKEIGETIRGVLSIRTSNLEMDEFQLERGQPSVSKVKVRCRYALRFADLKDETDSVLHRAGVVRDAFNSPFRPFILASTSIGQEGLDFHSYCHRVWHWNLPQNPVDLEQREGRVNRYKGHAVRKNVARAIGLGELTQNWRSNQDPWTVLFDAAKQKLRAYGTAENDIKPYWIFEEVEDPYRVERLVPLPPFSSEHARLYALKRSLAVYRLAFGQPRQEDLVTFLADQSEKSSAFEFTKYHLNLAPS